MFAKQLFPLFTLDKCLYNLYNLGVQIFTCIVLLICLFYFAVFVALKHYFIISPHTEKII